ncbi:radical SAM/SPASM domain-containing protein [Pseudomonas sp. PGPR40]|uniref:radical SAM/SPASM domain-containing protein n=1 Tax=Pseudomonas sp. PGPR40 TaxID=2913476 RepID=UPI001EDAF7EA|nr:radical SAM protein [Pseudomonas sp. PGPR40]
MTHQNLSPILSPPKAEDACSVILKLVGESCNLDCSYCYEKRKPYSGSRILKASTVQEFLLSIPHPKLAIELHGGEPLLYPKEEFKFLSKVLEDNQSRISRVTIQTNGTLLDEEFILYLHSAFPNIQIGISIDGPDEINSQRADIKGNSSFDSALKAISLCGELGVDVGVICVVSRQSLGKASHILDFFSNYTAIKIVKFVPCFDFGVTQGNGPLRRNEIRGEINAHGEQGTPWAISPAEYTDFILAATDYWIEGTGVDLFLMEPAVSTLRAVSGVPLNNCHYTSRKCAHVYTLYPDGTSGSCDELERSFAHYSNEPSNAYSGSIQKWSENISCEINSLIRKCLSCEYQSTCGGGCLATRKRLYKLDRDDEYCNHRKALIDNAKIMLKKE